MKPGCSDPAQCLESTEFQFSSTGLLKRPASTAPERNLQNQAATAPSIGALLQKEIFPPFDLTWEITLTCRAKVEETLQIQCLSVSLHLSNKLLYFSIETVRCIGNKMLLA